MRRTWPLIIGAFVFLGRSTSLPAQQDSLFDYHEGLTTHEVSVLNSLDSYIAYLDKPVPSHFRHIGDDFYDEDSGFKGFGIDHISACVKDVGIAYFYILRLYEDEIDLMYWLIEYAVTVKNQGWIRIDDGYSDLLFHKNNMAIALEVLSQSSDEYHAGRITVFKDDEYRPFEQWGG
jgi:hypothetical protein